ncbi:MAG TPA: hypothetical protein VFC31_07160 [Candidatus Limnocylindria bacterium]|nr:hypothetical protein [Candidatus Limnocylindria bacterium]
MVAADDELLGIGLVLAIVFAVLVFAMSGSVYAGVAGVDIRQVAAGLGGLLRSLAGAIGI